MSEPPILGLSSADKVSGATPEETASLRRQSDMARQFLNAQHWCGGVHDVLSGLQIPDIVGVLLCRVVPAEPDVDEWLWVIVGDLPPAYIVMDNAENAEAALEAYVGEMRAWAEAVQLGQPTDELIPVNVEPTPANADLLLGRLQLLDAYLEQEDDS